MTISAPRDVGPAFATTVGVIGCGPAGMMFLRQLELERERLLDLKADMETAANSTCECRYEEYHAVEQRLWSLPHVTVFESGGRCGGLWQSKLATESEDTDARGTTAGAGGTYDGMWINAPKENFEFREYTFDDHFRRPMPPFLTRKQVLGYLEGATKHTIDKYTNKSAEHRHGSILFDTEVSWVEYNESTQLFSIEAVPTSSFEDGDGTHDDYDYGYDRSEVQIRTFDKVILATGTENTARIPEREMELLKGERQDITFDGQVMHSSDIHNLADIKGKNLLIIGSSYSAEDLALSFIKRGANHIYVTTQSDHGPVASTSSWPMDKLTVMIRTEIKEVLERNRLRIGRADLPSPMMEDIAKKYYDASHNDVVLEDIDAVIFCTGYLKDYSILSNSLYPHAMALGKVVNPDLIPEVNGSWYAGDDEYAMVNGLGPNIYRGQTLPSETAQHSCGKPIHDNDGVLRAVPTLAFYSHDGTYNSHLISNPHFFYHFSHFDYPLLDLDIQSAYILKVMLGDIPTPGTRKEMHEWRSSEAAESLRHSREARFQEDGTFSDTYTLKHYEAQYENGERMKDSEDPPYDLAYTLYKLFLRAKLAGHSAGTMLVEADTRVADASLDTAAAIDCRDLHAITFTDETTLTGNSTRVWAFSDRGVAFLQQFLDFTKSHSNIDAGSNKTFRDYHHESYQSLYTGTKPSRFSQLWIDTDDIHGDDGVENDADCYREEVKNYGSATNRVFVEGGYQDLGRQLPRTDTEMDVPLGSDGYSAWVVLWVGIASFFAGSLVQNFQTNYVTRNIGKSVF